MTTIKLRALRRESQWLERAAAGEEILVTRRGEPYVRLSAPCRPSRLLGAGAALGARRAVTSEPTPAAEWKNLR